MLSWLAKTLSVSSTVTTEYEQNTSYFMLWIKRLKVHINNCKFSFLKLRYNAVNLVFFHLSSCYYVAWTLNWESITVTIHQVLTATDNSKQSIILLFFFLFVSKFKSIKSSSNKMKKVSQSVWKQFSHTATQAFKFWIYFASWTYITKYLLEDKVLIT